MFLNIIYVLATVSLLIGSSLSFNNKLPDYFFLVGFSLFCLNSSMNLLCEIRDKMKAQPSNSVYNHI